MKKLTLCLMAALLLLSLSPFQLSASTAVVNSTPVTSVSDIPSKKDALTARIDEIKAMDKTSMSFSEKRQIRKELRAAKSELRAISGGVYISAGALILILVLLIIFT